VYDIYIFQMYLILADTDMLGTQLLVTQLSNNYRYTFFSYQIFYVKHFLS
jgi:hypothetical protein